MAIRLKPITETSWLVLSDTEERVGLLTSLRDKFTLMISSKKQQFNSQDEVNTFFGQDVFAQLFVEEKPVEIKKAVYIRGFPVDVSEAHEIFTTESSLPLFTKKIGSETIYGAGYYCLYCSKGWMPAFCPKLSTLATYDLVGPFADDKEMRTELFKLRKTKNERNKKPGDENT